MEETMAKLDLNIGAQVHCKDGHAGKLVKLVVDPQTQQVTDLIVEQGLLLKHDWVLPVAVVERVADDAIHLNIHRQGMTDFARYREMTVKEPALDAYPAMRSSGLGAEFGAIGDPSPPMIRRRVHQGVSAGKSVIGRKTEVANLQQPIGHVDHIVVDSQSGRIADIVVRKGLLAEYVVIPAARIEEVGERDVLVSVGADEVADLPHYKPRAESEILAELHDRLTSPWPPVFSGVKASLEGGVLRLYGHVRSETLRCHAYELARIYGVIDIQNDLIVDSEAGQENIQPRNDKTVVRASEALSADPRTKDALIDLVQDRGVVTLHGQVRSTQARRAAEEIVAQQAGVATVVNELVVKR
jgi:osmotically-inducible protein OsmY